MSERIFNIFMYFEAGVATEYGMRHHRHSGLDEDKIIFLKRQVECDYPMAGRFPLPEPLRAERWFAELRQGIDLALFEEGFQKYRAGREPFICITPVVDGVPRVDFESDLSPIQNDKVGQNLPGEMKDWLAHYVEGAVFRFDRLINDDYFVAIKLLYNARHIASASKLLVSCIDTLAYVEFGDTRGNFVAWLETYVDLERVGVVPTELWEFRNSIIHMTNLSSRAVAAGRVAKLVPYIGSVELQEQAPISSTKYFNLHTLIQAIAAGIGRWAETYNANRAKFTSFVERYDTIISDSRLAEVRVTDSNPDSAFS